jgi:hypothetical protein
LPLSDLPHPIHHICPLAARQLKFTEPPGLGLTFVSLSVKAKGSNSGSNETMKILLIAEN